MVSHIKKILITAGPTREAIDPVRFLSNLSTGEMGYAIARAAVQKKYQVTLVSGPTSLKPPRGVRFIPVVTAQELKKTCTELFPKNDCLIMAAAVCDFQPRMPNRHKIPSNNGLVLKLKRTPDILRTMAKRKGRKMVIGFCLETRDLIRRAKTKLIQKNLDGMIANYYDFKTHIPFGNRRVETVFIDSSLKVLRVPKQSKRRIANHLLQWIGGLCRQS